jgi:hypothetical protein
MKARSSSELVDKEEGRCHSEVHDARCHVTIRFIDDFSASSLFHLHDLESSPSTVNMSPSATT